MIGSVLSMFDSLIKSLEEEGWNEDIIDDIKILRKKYLKEKLE